MMTVSISVNAEVVYARSVRNIKDLPGGVCLYKTDAGVKIKHKKRKGIISLAHKILKTIKETNQLKENK